MSDYFQHWLQLGQSLQSSGATLPAFFCVNWFRKDQEGRFVWPGCGENMRVLKWMIDRIENKAAWVQELKLHEELFKQLAHHLPPELPATQRAIAKRLDA